ncbi:uncharacterized protein LOC124933048 [Impatiens glandulifera]|uniref:uncharacterized protein LOC124933048 n=1 Tax=Impatiens glandulifera TaxID=253017 RepID=UPI001FB17DCD|nr:uncharacterized protein LOC124933048 [Impatiens glandulifera]
MAMSTGNGTLTGNGTGTGKSTGTAHSDLFSSLVSDIKNYTGKDPLLPWLRGIGTIRSTLPPRLVNEKLPRFLQKCAQTFETDQRYVNDLRYLRVWLQLMDYVDDPRGILRTMEEKQIGTKKSLFYQAYALYYEKMKKFEEADRFYHLGIQNHSEPVGDLQKSYEQFLHRMEKYMRKKNQVGRVGKRGHTSGTIPPRDVVETRPKNVGVKREDDSVVVKFLDTAIVGKSELEDACHHGLVEPTINTREVLNTINSMFKEPLEPVFHKKRPNRNNSRTNNGFEVFVDEDLDHRNEEHGKCEPFFQVYVDEECDEMGEKQNRDNMAFVFPSPNDEMEVERSSGGGKVIEDTLVHKFVGSTISDEPRVENACHHGLIEPTINLKEAMADINNMFGKPIDFVRQMRLKKKGKEEAAVPNNSQKSDGGFLILADDDDDEIELNRPKRPSNSISSSRSKENDLFEPTVFTKEAMDDISDMFRMPLDF